MRGQSESAAEVADRWGVAASPFSTASSPRHLPPRRHQLFVVVAHRVDDPAGSGGDLNRHGTGVGPSAGQADRRSTQRVGQLRVLAGTMSTQAGRQTTPLPLAPASVRRRSVGRCSDVIAAANRADSTASEVITVRVEERVGPASHGPVPGETERLVGVPRQQEKRLACSRPMAGCRVPPGGTDWSSPCHPAPMTRRRAINSAHTRPGQRTTGTACEHAMPPTPRQQRTPPHNRAAPGHPLLLSHRLEQRQSVERRLVHNPHRTIHAGCE